MLTRPTLRVKFLILGLLLAVGGGILVVCAFEGSYSYRWLAKGVSHRSSELPLASNLSGKITDLRVSYSEAQALRWVKSETGRSPVEAELVREDFHTTLLSVREALRKYGEQLKQNEAQDERIGDNSEEWEIVHELQASLRTLDGMNRDRQWMYDSWQADDMADQLERLSQLASRLPAVLKQRLAGFSDHVRGEYRWWIILTWFGTAMAVGLGVLIVTLFYYWVLRPLRVLIKGSRVVAGGDFAHRIQLKTDDETAELAQAMNAMTERFCEIRNDLDEKVRQRSQEVVRNEQLASVGFLAAGVAHEINNPLAAIAWSAESLNDQIEELLGTGDRGRVERSVAVERSVVETVRRYLEKIEQEAYRCKGITEKLLDFSRLGDVELQATDLSELVGDVIEMVRHVGKYKRKTIHFQPAPGALADVNPQEIKQVVLNLLTNGLESLAPGGAVWVEIADCEDEVELTVRDDGCGMTPEVLEHLFQPFFTRRQDGQGTGLGLSISYRIVREHGGDIVPSSPGPGQGSVLRVRLPRQAAERHAEKPKERDHRQVA